MHCAIPSLSDGRLKYVRAVTVCVNFWSYRSRWAIYYFGLVLKLYNRGKERCFQLRLYMQK